MAFSRLPDRGVKPSRSFRGANFFRGSRFRSPEFVRLFMVPGMQHCVGGPGASTFDGLTALEHWVEDGVAPEQIIASHVVNGAVERTRPLCPYPQVAVYEGRGSTSDAENFVCKVPQREHREKSRPAQ